MTEQTGTGSVPAQVGTGPRRAADFVFTFSYETYSDAVRRGMMRPPDRILASLMRSPEVRRLLVADPFRWLPRVAATPLLDRDVRFPPGRRMSLHRPVRMRRDDPTDLGAVDTAYRSYDRSLHRAARRLELVLPYVLTTNPLVAGFAPFEWASEVTFFARDDWSSSPAREAYWPAYRAAYRRISESGRPVAAVSEEIIDRIAPTGPSAVVPNGVEPSEWLGPLPPAPAWLDTIPGPRAVYVGTLDSRLDVPGIVNLATRCPSSRWCCSARCPTPRTSPTSAQSATSTCTRASHAPSSSPRFATPTSACSPIAGPPSPRR